MIIQFLTRMTNKQKISSLINITIFCLIFYHFGKSARYILRYMKFNKIMWLKYIIFDQLKMYNL